jgi:hypothetical protein
MKDSKHSLIIQQSKQFYQLKSFVKYISMHFAFLRFCWNDWEYQARWIWRQACPRVFERKMWATLAVRPEVHLKILVTRGNDSITEL